MSIIMNKDSIASTERILELLATIDGVTSKRMFGGHGVFHNDKMFGLFTAKGQRYFKANETTITDYTDKGTEKHSKMPYFSIPQDIMEEDAMLIVWAKKAIKVSK